VPAANVVVLSGEKGFKDPCVSGFATVDMVKKSLADVAAKAKPEDQFILFLVGHGVATEKIPTMSIPGPDVNVQELADGLSAIPARNQVVLNFTSVSGTMLKTLARAGRVNLAANLPVEGNETVAAEFFLRGLESMRADGEGAPAAGAKDGRITLLEAYNWATYQTALWMSRQKSKGGEWTVVGKESVEIFEKLCVTPPGTPGTQKLAADSDRTKPDEIVAISPPNGLLTKDWTNRRAISEHALLDDLGEPEGVAAVDSKTGYKPVVGARSGEQGYVAKRTVLGQADLLPPPPPPPEPAPAAATATGTVAAPVAAGATPTATPPSATDNLLEQP